MVVVSRAARKDVRSRAKGSPKERGRVRARVKGRRGLAQMSSVSRSHWARDCPSHHGGKGKRAVSSGQGSKSSSLFRQAYLEGDRYDWITGAGAFTVSVPSMVNFASFEFDGKFILDSGATMSMGGVDLLQKIQEIYTDAGLNLTSCLVKPLRLRFPFRKWKRRRVDECSAFFFGLAGNFLHSCTQRARTRVVGG